ncbi:MAG: MotB family protein, partial [Pseudomonadota bacterium]
FRGGTSDNWVLSFQRAHATKNALAENGVDETRFRRVEGLADREPKRPDDPFADENRRIEILYEPAENAQ